MNPSTVETVVLDLATGGETADLYDDAGGAVFSPDGSHVALITGSPHFAPEGDRRPSLLVDGEQIFPSAGAHFDILTRPVWSEDSTKLALVARSFGKDRAFIFVWERERGGSLIPFPAGEATTTMRTSWNGAFYLKAGKTIRAFDQTQELPNVSQNTTINYQEEGMKLSQSITAEIEQTGGRDVDLWCASCALASLPRGEGPEVRNAAAD